MVVKPSAYDASQVQQHWELFGSVPREGRAIIPRDENGNSGPVISVRLNTAEDVQNFVEKYAGTRVICFTVQPAPANYKGNKALKDQDFAEITTLFFDFDGKPGQGPRLAKILIPRLRDFTRKLGFKNWVFAVTDKGVHAYASVPAISIAEHPDIAQRIAYLTTVVLRKVVDGLCKTDSVFNLSRVVKIVGTSKPGQKVRSYFHEDDPVLVEDDKLREYLLKIQLSTPAEATAAEEATTEPVSTTVMDIVSGSAYMRSLIKEITPQNDRSAIEGKIICEFFQRGFTRAADIARFMVSLPRSKCKESGYIWALKDVARLQRKFSAESEAVIAPAEQRPRDEAFPNLNVFLAQPVPPIQWLFKGVLAKGMRILFAGEPKTLKSWAWVYLGLHTANLGHSVLYLAGEGHVADWQNRFRMVAEGHDINLKKAGPHFRFALRPGIDLLNQETLRESRALVMDEKPSLVIVDTLRSQMGGDENDSEKIAVLIKNLDFLTAGLEPVDQPALAIVHHTRKPGQNNGGGGAGNRARGSSALWGHVDSVIVSTQKGKPSDDPDRRLVTLDVDHRFAASSRFEQLVRFDLDEGIRVEIRPLDQAERARSKKENTREEPQEEPQSREERGVPKSVPIISVVPATAMEKRLRIKWAGFRNAKGTGTFSQNAWMETAGGNAEAAKQFFKRETEAGLKDGSILNSGQYLRFAAERLDT